MFWAEIWKYQNFLSENFPFMVVKFSIYLNRHVFVMLFSISTKYRNYYCIIWLICYYTPDIRSMLGYNVFAFPFVRPFVRSYVRTYVLSFDFPSQGQSFCIKVYKTSYFKDPLMDFIYIWHDGRYRSKDFISTIPTPGWPWGQGHGLRIFIKSQSFFVCLSLYSYIIKTLEEFHLYLTCW